MTNKQRDKIKKKYKKKKEKEKRIQHRARALLLGAGTFSLQNVIQAFVEEISKKTKHGELARKFIADGMLRWEFQEFEHNLWLVANNILSYYFREIKPFKVWLKEERKNKITYGNLIDYLKKFGKCSNDLKSKLGRYKKYRDEAFHYDPESPLNQEYPDEKWWIEREKWQGGIRELHVDLVQWFNAMGVVFRIDNGTFDKIGSQYGDEMLLKDFLPNVYDAFGLPHNRKQQRKINSIAKKGKKS